MGRLDGKIAVVTGANSGIGKATALRLAAEGAALVLAARRLEKLRDVERIIKDSGGRAISVHADVGIRADCDEIIESAVREYGRIDILVNNAGVADKNIPITRCTDEWWDQICRINQSSVFYICRAALKYMEPVGYGSIINVSSIGGVFGSSGMAYSASKTAVIGITKNIAIQFAGLGIRCNAVCPGATPTPLNTPEKVAEFDEFGLQCLKHMNISLPQPTVEDQANAILFFASDESKAVTGQVLIVDNGATL